MSWPTVLGLLAVGAAVVMLTLAWGRRRWRRGTATLRAQILAASGPAPAGAADRVDLGRLDDLPPPVQRYLKAALRDGAPLVARARFQHEGDFDTSEKRPRWARFRSDQLVVTAPPGFDWDGRVRMLPGLDVHVHDAYVAGEGRLTASLAGLVRVAELRGGAQVAEGELMRFLAEAPWYPTRLLPGPSLQWQAVDDNHARATLRDGEVAATLTFGFGADHMVSTVRADARPRLVGSRMVPTAWQGRFWDYTERDGMRVPLQGEVAWIGAEGPRAYWRGRLLAIAYDWLP